MTNNASMEETLRAEVECLRKLLAEKDKEIQHLKDLLDDMAEETQDDKSEILHKIIQTKVDPFLALIQLSNIDKLREQAERIRCEYEPFVKWDSMSKEPEVGDVFYVKHFPLQKRIITHIIEYKNTITYVVFNGRQTYEASLSRIKKELKYLGKSKANIDDLFKTENEE